MRAISVLGLAPLCALVLAGPASIAKNRQRDLASDLAAILPAIRTAISQGDSAGTLQALQNIVPLTSAPTSVAQAVAELQGITNGTAAPPQNIFEFIGNLRALNLIDSIDSLSSLVQGVADGQSSTNNINPPPPDMIYPKSSCDAPYSVAERDLRAAIYIPPAFTYGQKPPVILFPGTGNFGYETFKGNFIPLLTGQSFADPVWVNVPGRLLNDAQKNAEFAAYAINYIQSVTQTKVTMLGWSQGNIDTQWAFKYWPSTISATSNHVAISPDYAGTIFANFITPPGAASPPSILQQRYLSSSNFITTLRSCDGDSGYVPTTTIYSGFFDEIVEPMQGTGASAFLKDVRGVGVSNNEVQVVCGGQPLQLAGTFYTHEGVLYNPLAFALLRDAMTNGGPGLPSRLNLASVCSTYLTPGLDLGNFIVTENAIAIAGLAILTYPTPVLAEPAISAYAATCPVNTCFSTSTTSISTSTSSSSSTTLTTSVTTTTATTTTVSTTMTTTTTRSSSAVTSTLSATSLTTTTRSSSSMINSPTQTTTSTSVTGSSSTQTTSNGSTSSPSTTKSYISTTSSSSTSTNVQSSQTGSYTGIVTISTSSGWQTWNSWSGNELGNTKIPDTYNLAQWSTLGLTYASKPTNAPKLEGLDEWSTVSGPVKVRTITWTSGTNTYTTCITETVVPTSYHAVGDDWVALGSKTGSAGHANPTDKTPGKKPDGSIDTADWNSANIEPVTSPSIQQGWSTVSVNSTPLATAWSEVRDTASGKSVAAATGTGAVAQYKGAAGRANGLSGLMVLIVASLVGALAL